MNEEYVKKHGTKLEGELETRVKFHIKTQSILGTKINRLNHEMKLSGLTMWGEIDETHPKIKVHDGKNFILNTPQGEIFIMASNHFRGHND